jgi:hypothetical protein
MPVLNRRRATRALIVAAAAVPLLLAGGAGVMSVLIGQHCAGGTGLADSASQVAQRNIPPSVLAIYQSVGARYRIPWELLAGIGEEECDHGRNPNPSRPSDRPASVGRTMAMPRPACLVVAGGRLLHPDDAQAEPPKTVRIRALLLLHASADPRARIDRSGSAIRVTGSRRAIAGVASCPPLLCHSVEGCCPDR